jgi:hypothetical protein
MTTRYIRPEMEITVKGGIYRYRPSFDSTDSFDTPQDRVKAYGQSAKVLTMTWRVLANDGVHMLIVDFIPASDRSLKPDRLEVGVYSRRQFARWIIHLHTVRMEYL